MFRFVKLICLTRANSKKLQVYCIQFYLLLKIENSKELG
jgi:hypothetical protein